MLSPHPMCTPNMAAGSPFSFANMDPTCYDVLSFEPSASLRTVSLALPPYRCIEEPTLMPTSPTVSSIYPPCATAISYDILSSEPTLLASTLSRCLQSVRLAETPPSMPSPRPMCTPAMAAGSTFSFANMDPTCYDVLSC